MDDGLYDSPVRQGLFVGVEFDYYYLCVCQIPSFLVVIDDWCPEREWGREGNVPEMSPNTPSQVSGLTSNGRQSVLFLLTFISGLTRTS